MEGHLLLNSLSVLSYCAQSKTGNLTAPEILYQYCTALSCLQLNLSTACVCGCVRGCYKSLIAISACPSSLNQHLREFSSALLPGLVFVMKLKQMLCNQLILFPRLAGSRPPLMRPDRIRAGTISGAFFASTVTSHVLL